MQTSQAPIGMWGLCLSLILHQLKIIKINKRFYCFPIGISKYMLKWHAINKEFFLILELCQLKIQKNQRLSSPFIGSVKKILKVVNLLEFHKCYHYVRELGGAFWAPINIKQPSIWPAIVLTSNYHTTILKSGNNCHIHSRKSEISTPEYFVWENMPIRGISSSSHSGSVRFINEHKKY